MNNLQTEMFRSYALVRRAAFPVIKARSLSMLWKRGEVRDAAGSIALVALFMLGLHLNKEKKLEYFLKPRKDYPSGDSYIGDLTSDGVREGKGYCMYSSGSSYNGDWKNDKPDGRGVFEYKDLEDPILNHTYTGEMKTGLKHGKGVYSFSNGERLVGKWVEGRAHGRMIHHFPSGVMIEEEWVDGECIER